VWGLREILDYAEVVLNRDDIDAKAGALIDFLADRVVGKRFEAPELRDAPFLVESFADLDELFRAIFDFLEVRSRGAEVWRTHHAATIRKVRNRLGNVATRSKGLVTDDGPANDLPWGAFRDRSLTVIDVAGVDPLAQDLVFARVISRLREALERRDLGVDHVIVFVDELNKYASTDGHETYVKRMLLDLSERGRYLGLVLFSAQQFRSQVLRRVVGNAGTGVFGRMDADELALPGYATLTPAVRAKLAALPKGELLLRHPHFTQPVFVRFPRPAMLSGREGVERFPPAHDVPFAEAVVTRLRRLDPAIPADAVREAIDGRPDDEVRRALGLVARERPGDVLAFFRACLRRVIRAESRGPAPGITPLPRDDDNPFAPY
jgi:DNA helicase HerA-like ATPase